MSEDSLFDYLLEGAQKVELVVRGMVKGALDAVVGLNAGDVRAD